MSELDKDIPANRKDTGRNPDGTFKAGVSGNPKGRPANTMKDYVRQKFMGMDDKQKEKFLKSISSEVQWKMGEGNPQSDITSGGESFALDDESKNKAEEARRQAMG